MDSLPQVVIEEILSRLSDSFDLARCRMTCKFLNDASREVRSINLLCTLSRYLRSRSPLTNRQTMPFKTVFKELVESLQRVNSVMIGVEKALGSMAYDDVDDADDLYLTDVGFVSEWLPRISGELNSLSITDFWIQSCWRRSEILPLISCFCKALTELELKNAWLSVDGLSPMLNLTSLTLEFIRLDDEYLDKINDCFPSLQALNLIGVGGLTEPKIRLSHLRTCAWTVSNAPRSLSIFAPSLKELKLKCVKPNSLVLEAPLLLSFYFSIEEATRLCVKEFVGLRNLQLESTNMFRILYMFPPGNTVEKLTVDSPRCLGYRKSSTVSIESLFQSFPNTSSLCLRPGAWSDIESSFSGGGGLRKMLVLKELTAHLVINDIDFTLSLISFILGKCPNLSDVALFIHHDADQRNAFNLVSRCSAAHPIIHWKWGIWKEDGVDTWVSDPIALCHRFTRREA